MDVHGVYLVHLVHSFSAQSLLLEKSIYTMYIQLCSNMVRRMKATITQIESVVTPSGNSGHVVVPKAWIGKETLVKVKENRSRGKK
jgi:putative transposon-encoded protein